MVKKKDTSGNETTGQQQNSTTMTTKVFSAEVVFQESVPPNPKELLI